MVKILKCWLPVIICAVVIFFFSSNPDPYRYLPEAWRSAVPLPIVSNSSLAEWIGQLLHFIEYTILAFLLMRALTMTFPLTTKFSKINLFNTLRSPRVKRVGTPQHLNTLSILTIVLAMVFALSDEIHQLFVPGRAFQVVDLVIDLLGSLAGVYLYARFKYGTTKTQRSQSFLRGLF